MYFPYVSFFFPLLVFIWVIVVSSFGDVIEEGRKANFQLFFLLCLPLVFTVTDSQGV